MVVPDPKGGLARRLLRNDVMRMPVGENAKAVALLGERFSSPSVKPLECFSVYIVAATERSKRNK